MTEIRYGSYKGDGTTQEGSPQPSKREEGRYLADPDLVIAVNTALAVEQPILVTGEPGVGKSMLAWSMASELGLGDVLEFHTRSDHRARDALYTFDNLKRFYHAQVGDASAQHPQTYILWQALGEAIRSGERRVVLIDEIDKAPRDFSNDLLDEVDRMKFTVPELGATYESKYRPVVVITSNSERELPDAFLRRCVFHHIEFPNADRLHRILSERLGHLHLPEQLVQQALRKFLELRELRDVEKKPASAELIVWVRCLCLAGIDGGKLRDTPLGALPSLGALIKTREDLRAVRNASE
jgi:MoxR-like ATPase